MYAIYTIIFLEEEITGKLITVILSKIFTYIKLIFFVDEPIQLTFAYLVNRSVQLNQVRETLLIILA